MKTEFKIGDKVTFKPYEKDVKAIVREVITDNHYLDGSVDDRVFYKLSGRDGSSLVTTTTGASIVESKLFGSREYKINFTGRKNGAIGVVYEITDYRTALTPEKAVLALYDEYEHIHSAVSILNN